MKKTLRIIIVAIILAGVFSPASLKADEGMWMVQFLEQIYPKMKKAGIKLKQGEIYNAETGNAIADAIVSLDFGCTGSMISNKGLMITNHHCAYGDIHSLSTPEKNYLEDGFWAMNSSDEKYIKGKSAYFLRKVVDVTPEVSKLRDSVEKCGNVGMVMRRVYRIIEEKYSKTTDYEVSCSSMWGGTKYYMFYYDVYTDVRLVGAPPVSIGAFGGETDNWGWPQHKGDFAIYRIYADENGRPAKYSASNVPFQPKKILKVSDKGVKEGDYAMILGYPGRTNRYVSSYEIKQKQEILNPIIVEARRGKLNIWDKHMKMDPAVRLLYSDKYFGISNYTDYAKWENKCFKMYDVQSIRRAEEDLMRKGNSGMLDKMKKGFAAKDSLTKYKAWYRESFLLASEWTSAVNRINPMVRNMQKEKMDSICVKDALLKKQLNNTKKDFAKFNKEADMELLKFNIGLFIKNVPSKYYSDTLNAWVKRFNGCPVKIAEYINNNSVFNSIESMEEYFSTPRKCCEIKNDPAILFVNACSINTFNALEDKLDKELGFNTDNLRNKYVKALYAYRESQNIPQSPDANSTMRLTYGKVGGIEPYDGVSYNYRTTIKGYKEKEDPDNYEFNVKPQLKSLIESKDWGRWGENGELYVNFLTNNDITGGNSGSPVINGKGEIIGLAFDGNRESMSGDAYYHPTNFKTVCVDIRFVMWVIEKYGNADHIIKEIMN